MKKIILFIGIVFIYTGQLLSQCGTKAPTSDEYRYVRDVISEVLYQRNDATSCVPVRAHIVRHSDGSGGVSLEDVNKGIAQLNQYYLPAGIEFYLCGSTPDYLDSDTYYEYEDNQEDAMAAAAVEVNNALNMYFVNSITIPGFGQASGYAYFPFNNIISTRVVMRNDVVAQGNTMVHELGHWFSLFHTHQGTEAGSGSADAENVARPPSALANCTDHGDLICDTPADPRYDGLNFSFGTCSYIGDAVDANGELYAPDTDNAMSYYPDQCQNPFILTPEQYTRIGQGYITRQGHNQYSLDFPFTNVNNPSNLTATINATGVFLDWNDNSSNEMGFLIERSSTSATDGFSPYVDFGTGPNQSDYTDESTLETNTTYWYRVKASNDNCNHYSNAISITTAMYCSAGSNQCDEFISNVSVGTINQSSACSAGGYQDYSAVSTIMNIGQAYPISITNGPPTYTNDQCGVWVDWNQDGDFDDASETITISGGTALYSGSITPPASALSGTTKMRVRVMWTGTLSACGDATYGEVEDYSIEIPGGDPGEVNFNPNTYTVSEDDGTVTVTLSRTGGNSGLTVGLISAVSGTATELEDFAEVFAAFNWPDGVDDDISFSLPIYEDFLVEGDEQFTIIITELTNSTLGANSVATITIEDTTNPGEVQFSDLVLGLFEIGTHNLAVSRTGGSDGPVSVTVNTQSGTATEGVDFEAVNLVLNWADGELGDKIVPVTVYEDVIEEGTETFTMSLTNPVNVILGDPNVRSLDIIDYSVLSAKAFLEGPFNSDDVLMDDNIRSLGSIPLTEPFTGLGFTHVYTGGGETTTPGVLAVTGNDAIVDWVFVEIHHDADPAGISMTISALIQRDGDIVETDGISPLKFPITVDYFVVVRHRNHFGVRSLNALTGTSVSSIDFSDPTTQVYGVDAMNFNIESGTMVMISGDANSDGQVNSVDKNLFWRLQNGLPFDYINSNADMNMDGAINAADKNLYWRPNNSKIEQLLN